MKIVFDTNVLISAFLWDDSAAQKILLKIIDKNYNIYTTIEILKEFENVIKRDFDYSDKESIEIISKILNVLFVVSPKEAIKEIKEDMSDNKILECAVASNADYILSYDKHLLKLYSFRNIKIMKPEQLKI